MTSDASLGRNSRTLGRPAAQHDLGEWMLNQQRQFQEFERSFQSPSFSSDFFSSPFSTGGIGGGGGPSSLLAVQNPPNNQQQHQQSLTSYQTPTHAYPTEDRAMSQTSSDMSPKAKVSYDQDKFQVEFNVQDYSPEELSIKTEGDTLIVQAKHETKTSGGGSFVAKQFEQRFSLPSGVKIEKIASSLSKDGILTVSAPRENLALSSSYQKRGAIENRDRGQVESKQQPNEGLPQPKVTYDDDNFQISLDVSTYRPEDLDVKVEGSTIIITAKQEIPEPSGTRTRVFEQKFTLPSGVKAELVRSSLTREGQLVIKAPKGNTQAQQSYTESIESRMDKTLDPSSWESNDRHQQRDMGSFEDSRRDSALSSMRSGGSFFDSSRPSFFDDRSIFDRDRSAASLFDRDDRSLFPSSNASREQNGGGSRVQYDDDTYKIVVNVENFKPEELVIKTVDNTVIVEAKHEEKTTEGRSYSTQSLNQSYTLPRGINPESVTSALSKEGILTISAPLPKALKGNSSERLVPIQNF